MNGVHSIFEDLQPVTWIMVLAAGDKSMARPAEAIVLGKGWLLLRRSHIREHNPIVFVRRVGGVAEPVFQRARRRLARRFENRPIHIE